jgi:hypothetical protein
MAERKVGNQNVNLISDHQKSRITLIYVLEGGVPHILRKLSRKATILF